MKNTFNIGDVLIAENSMPLKGNEVAPPLIVGEQYTVHHIIEDSQGNQHLDVGLKSKFNYIRSWETKEELKDGDKIHWCHPSRFTKKG